MLIAFTAALVATGAASQPPSFCQRVAERLDMKPVAAPPAKEAWQRYLLNPAQRFLVGGRTPPISMAVMPLGDAKVPATTDICKTGKKSYACGLTGPLKFYIALAGVEVTEELRSGETATVDTPGVRLRCRAGLYAAE